MAQPTTTESNDFAAASTDFIKWFSEAKRTEVNPNIKLVDLRSEGRGRGVIATQDIDEGETILVIPMSIVLTTGDSGLPKDFKKELKQHGYLSSLIVAFIYEYLQGKNSIFYHYLQILPTDQIFDTLMNWSEEELAELQACAVVEKVGRKDTETKWHETTIPMMMNRPDLFPISGSQNFKTNEFLRLSHMAGGIIMAYSFSLDCADIDYTKEDENGSIDMSEEELQEMEWVKDELLEVMVPFADMLNADADRANAQVVDDITNQLVVIATKDIEAGDEIFNTYGDRPRSDMLRMYGYITDNYKQYDLVEISTTMIDGVDRITPKQKKRLEELLEDGDEEEESETFSHNFLINRQTDEDGRIEHVIDDCLVSFVHVFVPTETRAGTTPLEDETLTLEQLQFIKTLLSKRLAQYKTSLENDIDIQMKLNSGDTTIVPAYISLKHYRDAVEIRKGEKEILTDAIAICEKDIQRVSDKMTASNTKKRKQENRKSFTTTNIPQKKRA